jgi:hypothetical protein
MGYIAISAGNIQQLERRVSGVNRDCSQHPSYAAEAAEISVEALQIEQRFSNLIRRPKILIEQFGGDDASHRIQTLASSSSSNCLL